MVRWGRIARWVREGIAWGVAVWHVLGWLGLTGLVIGLGVSIGGVVWAVITGVPIPIVIMAAYCTLVGAVYLTLAPAAFRALSAVPRREATQLKKYEPNYDAWRHIDRFSVNQAAHLWCELEPEAIDTYDTSTWKKAFSEANRKGELEFDRSGGSLFDYARGIEEVC